MGREIAFRYPDPLGNIERAVARLPRGHTRETLLVLVEKTKRESGLLVGEVRDTQHELEQLRLNVEQWFTDAMQRVGGWYKRWTQRVQLVLAGLIVLVANADTIGMANRLTHDDALRASVVQAASQASAAPPMADASEARTKLLHEARTLTLPLGWTCAQAGLQNCVDVHPGSDWHSWDFWIAWLLKLVGLLISVMAVSMGAPFWFDTLSKFVNLRGAGTPPGDTKKSAGR
jgi:hypothetical protein